MKKLIILMLMLLLGIATAAALEADDSLMMYYLLNDTKDFTGNYEDLTLYNGITTSSCFETQCYDFDGTNDYIVGPVLDWGNEHTVSIWVYVSSYTSSRQIFTKRRGSTREFHMQQYSAGLYMQWYNGGTNDGGGFGRNNWIYDSWNHIVMKRWHNDTVNKKYGAMYINGVHIDTNNNANKGLIEEVFTLGRISPVDNGQYWLGQMSKLAIFNRTLEDHEITSIYQNNITFPGIDIVANVENYYNKTNISIPITTQENTYITYSLNNQTQIQVCSNCNTTTLNLTGLSEKTHYIEIFAQDATKNISFIVDLTKPEVNLTSNIEISQYRVNTTDFLNYSDTYISTCRIFSPEYNISCDSNIDFLENGNITLNFEVIDFAGNKNQGNFNVFVNPLINFTFLNENSLKIENFTFGEFTFSNNSSIKLYDLGIGEHVLEFSKVGFGDTNVSFNFTNTTSLLSFEIQFAKIEVLIYDRNNELITTYTNINLVGQNGLNYSVFGSETIINQDFQGDYRIEATNSNYIVESQEFSFNNKEVKTIRFYLLELNASNTLTLFVKNSFGGPISNAAVNAQIWYNNTWKTISSVKSNSNGEAIFQSIEENTWYKFCGTKTTQTGCIQEVKITNNELENGLNIVLETVTIPFSNSDLEIYTIIPNMTIIELNETHNYFQEVYFDEKQIASKYCLKLFENDFQKTFVKETCSNSHSGTLIVSFENSTSYLGEFFAYVGSKPYSIEQLNYKVEQDLASILGFWTYALAVLVFIALVYLGLRTEIMELLVLSVIPIMFILVYGFNWFNDAVFGLVTLFAIVIAIFVNREG